MNLAQLTKDMPELIRITSGEETEIGFLTADSRAKGENGLFFCLPGARFDGHDFAPQALENGCTALWWSADSIWTARRWSLPMCARR